METTLRMFDARAIFALCIAFLAVLAIAGAALAQEAGPITVAEPTTQDLIGLVFSSASAAVVSIVGALLAVALRHAPKWVVAIVDHLTTNEAVKWETLLNSGLDRAEAYARSKIDPLKDRDGFVRVMVGFLDTFNPEIVRWADQNKNGVIDLIESRLPQPLPPTKPANLANLPTRRKAEAVQ